MTDASYTDEGTLADYYLLLSTCYYVSHEKVLTNLRRWIDSGEIILVEASGNIFDPAKQPYKLCPRMHAYLIVEIGGVPHESYNFRVRIPVIERKSTVETYPPPERPPRFKVTVARLFGAERTIERLLAEDPEALKGDAEIEAAKWLAPKLTPDDKVKRDTHKAECMKQFKLDSDRAYGRVWAAARYLAGLPKQREGGRPTKK
jgi:hypothetical protein